MGILPQKAGWYPSLLLDLHAVGVQLCVAPGGAYPHVL